MKQIRKNVFETNSSSTHSFSHSKGTYNNLTPDPDGFLYLDLQEFGWGPFNCHDSESKLAYLLLAAAYYTDHSFWYYDTGKWNEEWNSFQTTDLFQDIQKEVCEYLKCEAIIINEGSNGYIDHQSLPYGVDLYSWLKEEIGVDNITDFIFGDVVMHIDNDNH